MKNSLLKGLLVFLAVTFTGFAQAQNITGKVSDSNGPIPGASVTEKGTSNSAQTDFDGNFTMKNVKSDAVLVISYVGMKTQEVSVAGKSSISVVLKSEELQLSEVMVIGYGSVKKKDATGAVDAINSKSFDNVAAASPAELLRGKVSGVQVTQSSGEPGAGVAIRIRGNSSIRSGNNPLIVIDGVPLDGGNISSGSNDSGLGSSSPRNPLNFVNQNDIESITILKDASSTAIYGSRGANGVIVITTKKAKSKEPQFTYSNSFQFSRQSGDFGVMSADEFLAAGGTDKGGREYNWKNAILQPGFSTSHDVSFSKATENSNTRLSFGATTADGIVKNTGLAKYTASLYNSNDYFGGKLKIESKIQYAALKDRTTLITNNVGYQGNLIGSALYWNPTLPIHNADGSYYSFGNGGPQGPVDDDYLNPVQLLNSYKDFTNTQKFLANITSTYKFNSHLSYKFLFGIETSNSVRKQQLLPSIHIKDIAQATASDGVKRYGMANIYNQSKFNRTFEHTLNYNNKFGENFDFDALVGYSYYDYNADGYFTGAKGFNAAQTNLIDNIEGGSDNAFRADSYRNKVELQSYFARFNATIYNKLLVTATLRSDGSTKLGKNNKYDYFPSFGLGYKLVDGKEGMVNSLKVRASYGVTGNQEFAPNSAIARVAYATNGSQGDQVNSNADLKWETTKSTGFGLDFTLLKNKLSGSLDYFTRDTKDLIFPVPAAATQPGPPAPRFKNLPGNLINKGVEVALNYKLMEKDDFTWDVSANASFLSNEMKNFTGFLSTGALNGQGLTNAYAQVITNNAPIYSYYLYEWRGYDAQGNSIYADAAGNDTGLGLAAKKLTNKQPLPKMNVGFSTSATYKAFDATASFYGAFGHYIYNNTENAYFFKSAFLGGRNVTAEAANSEQAQGDPNSPSTKYLEKGDFLRLGNLTVGYTLKNEMLQKWNVKSARFFVNGANLFILTKYSGFDPEVDTDKSLNGIPSAGMDYLAYPRDKSYSLGINVTF